MFLDNDDSHNEDDVDGVQHNHVELLQAIYLGCCAQSVNGIIINALG